MTRRIYIPPAIETIETDLCKDVLGVVSKTEINHSGTGKSGTGELNPSPKPGTPGEEAKGTVWDDMGESGNVWE